jgi:hypothetical protein
MANQFLNAQEYANTMLLLAKNQLVTGRMVNGKFTNQVTDENGLTISVKRPPRFARNNAAAFNATLAAQDIVTGSVNLAVNQYAKVHISVGDIEYVQSYNQLMRNETMKSAASTLAHQIDSFLQSKCAEFHSHVGTVTPNTDTLPAMSSPQNFNRVHTRLMNQGVPNSELHSTFLFDDGELIRGTLIGGDIQGVNRSALERTRIPILSEIDLYATQQCPSITTGTRLSTGGEINNGTLAVNYRDVKDSMTQTVAIDGLGANATFKVGELFTIEGVFAWDWRNNVRLPYLQQFVVRGGGTTSVPVGSAPNTTCTANASGEANIIISPPLIVQGTNDGVSTDANTAFATVSTAAVDGADIIWLAPVSTTYRVRTAWHKSAISMVSARLHTPFTGESSFATDPETGISIRYWRGSDISTGAHVHRWDCIYGATNVDAFMGARVSNLT